MSGGKNEALFFFDESVKGSPKLRIAHYEEFQNLLGSSILQQNREFNCLFFKDPAFTLPIPGNMIPFNTFPKLNFDVKTDGMNLASVSTETQIPHLFFSISSLNRENEVTIKFRHKSGLIPTIEQHFPVKIDSNTKLQNLLQPIFDQKTWRPSIEYIAKQLEIDTNRIVLYHSINNDNQVLFPFQKIEPFEAKMIDAQSGQYIFNGKFSFEILPNIYDNIESHEMQMKDKFIDTEEERNSFFYSLPPPLMAQLVNFQKKVFNLVHKNTMRDLFAILIQLISAEFNFDAFDKIIIIGLKHILSATFVDIFIPYLASVTKKFSLYQLKTWKEFSTWCTNNKSTFLNYSPKDDELEAMCMIYFAVTQPNFPEKIVNLTHKFLNHYMVKASDLKLPPIQVNCFLGDPVYSTAVKVNNKNDFVLLLTRGFVYLVNATTDSKKYREKDILPERLNLTLHSSESFSIPLLKCEIFPIPSEQPNAAFLASEDTKIVINFPNPESQLTFTTLLYVAKSEIKKTTVYPLQVPKTSVRFIFMKNKIHAKVNASEICWDVYFTHEDVSQALKRAGSSQSFKIIPSIETTVSRLNSTEPNIKCLGKSVSINSLLEIVLGSSIDHSLCRSFINSWSYSVLYDMIFCFSSKSSFEGLRVLKISDFSHAISLNSKELLQIQCEYFTSFLSDFKVNNTPLIYYASLVCSNSAIIRCLIETNKMPKDDGSRFQRTAFFYALRNPNISILQALLDYSDSFSIENAYIDKDNVTPLIYCIQNNDESRAILLLRNGALVHNSLDTNSASALEYVISTKNERMLNLIMPYCGPQVNAPNIKGQFVTHLCINAGFFQGLRIIEALDNYYNPNMYSDICPHPLHAFIEINKNHTANDMMSLLRLTKINVNAFNKKHETPLMAALIRNQNEFVRLIAKDPRCNLDLYNEEGMSALSLAVKNRNIEAIKILIEAGALVDQPNQDGKTPLLFALSIDNPNKDICRLLIANSRVYQWYSNGKLPIDIAPNDLRADIERRKPPQFNAISFRYNQQAKQNK